MHEVRRQILLSIATAGLAVLVLTPVFLGLKLLLDAGLEIVFVTVIAVALFLGYLLRRDTMG
jgi:hypothetical protein